jgi:hypothetical protein
MHLLAADGSAEIGGAAFHASYPIIYQPDL